MTDFYSASGAPTTSSSGSSATIRAEFTSIQTAFGLLAGYTGKPNQIPFNNSSGTGQTALSTFTFDGSTLLAPSAHITGVFTVDGHVNLEGITSTGATGSGKLVFSNSPALVTPALGTPASGVLTNCTGTAAGLTAGSAATAVSVSTVTTKGDLYAGGVAGAASRLGVGSDGQLLTGDSAQTNGLAYTWPAVPAAASRNLTARTNSVTPNTKFDIAADQIVVKNTSGAAMVLNAFSATVNCAGTGALGMDTGAQPTSGWVYGWVIAKPDGTTSAIGSTSPTAPTMPSGYTFKALATAVYSNGSTNFAPYRQVGNSVYYETGQTGYAGSATTETAVSLVSAVPPIAHIVRGYSSVVGVVCDGGGNGVATHILRIVSGATFWALTSQVALSPGAAFYQAGGALEFPNIGQNFYYLNSVSNGTSPIFNVTITGFTLPIGV